jgi:hypothetical protein
MYENRNQNVGSALLKEKSLSDMLNAADYYESIAAYEQKMLEEFKANRILIEEQEARLVAEKAELDNLKAAAEAAGMSRPSESQIYYIDLPGADQAVAYGSESGGVLDKFFASLGRDVYAVMEYFR